MCFEQGIVAITRDQHGGGNQPRGSRLQMIRIAIVRQVADGIFDRVVCQFRRALARIIGRELDPSLYLGGV